jgi:hypothetical protein
MLLAASLYDSVNGRASSSLPKLDWREEKKQENNRPKLWSYILANGWMNSSCLSVIFSIIQDKMF